MLIMVSELERISNFKILPVEIFNSGDYFAVRVTEDPIYATPIFFTEGGTFVLELCFNKNNIAAF